MKRRIVAFTLSLIMLTTCIFTTPVFAGISSAGEAELVTEQVRNNEALEEEQLIVKADGTFLEIEGRTKLPPLECTEPGEQETYVTSFKNLSTGTFGAPYITMFPTETICDDGTIQYEFQGRYDFSKVADGKYLMYLWRGKYKNGYNYLGSKYGKGILSYDTLIEVRDGQVGIVRYPAIQAENEKVLGEIDALGTEIFLDTSLYDIRTVTRDPRDIEAGYTALSEEEQAYIKMRAEEITAGCSTDYERVKAIYEFAAENLYYDKERNTDRKSYDHPYYNLYNMDNKVANGYNSTEDGYVSTACTGYAALVTALTRSLGIPTRLVRGVHPAIENTEWPEVTNFSGSNHYWAECYVDGRWIMVDANLGTSNKYYHSTGQWSYTGVSSYTWFDPTPQQLAVHYLHLGVYRMVDPVITTVEGLRMTAHDNASVTVAWKPMEDAIALTGYYLRCYNADGEFIGGMHVTEGTQYTFNKLGAGKNYTIEVCGYGFLGSEKVYGKPTTIHVGTKPNKVLNLKTTNGTTSIKATWSARTCAGYEVTLYDSAGTILSRIYTPDTNYTFYKLSPVTNYTVKVRPYVTIGTGKYPAASFATVKACTVPSKAASLTTTRSSSAIKAKWSKTAGENGYQVQILNVSGTVLQTKYVSGTDYTFTDLKPSFIYQVRVRPYKLLDGTKNFGPYAKVSSCTIPQKASMKTLTTGKQHYVKATWAKITCSGYEVMIATNSSFTKGVKKYTVSTTSKKFTGLKRGQYYYVKVRPYKLLNGKKYYAGWSKYKYIKCK